MPNDELLDRVRQELLAGPLSAWSDLKADRARPPRRAGIYAWFFKSLPLRVTSEGCSSRDDFHLLYVGISPESPESRATLRSRIRYHFRGNAEGSTLRRTLGCLLEPEIGTCLRRVGSGDRMTFADGENQLSSWLADNARVSWVELDEPWLIEPDVIRSLSLPLNIRGNEGHAFYETLRAIRRAARARARQEPILGSVPHDNSMPTNHAAPASGISEEMLIDAWRQFRRYVETEMGHTNRQNARKCINGAGAFVDFLRGRRPRPRTRYATSSEWPT
jgi:hypothetical protein